MNGCFIEMDLVKVLLLFIWRVSFLMKFDYERILMETQWMGMHFMNDSKCIKVLVGFLEKELMKV